MRYYVTDDEGEQIVKMFCKDNKMHIAFPSLSFVEILNRKQMNQLVEGIAAISEEIDRRNGILEECRDEQRSN